MATLPGSGASAQRAKTSQADTPITPEKLRTAIPLLDDYAKSIFKSGAIPGFSIGVVHNDEVVYLAGFGAREMGKPEERVDADTVFQLASLSKPISSTVISALITGGTVSWDDPVVKHDPRFRMHDPAVTPVVTIGDMFSHRSGLYGQAGNDLEQIGYSQQTILERLQVLASAYPFRQGYQYSNYGLTEGAIAAAKAASQPWPDLAASKLYAPLRMTSTSSRYSDFASRINRAHLHVLLGGTWVPLVSRVADAQAPAGGASSSVRDLMQWVRLELGNGVIDGRRLIDAHALEVARRPQAINGKSASGEPTYYGYGWSLEQDSDGIFRINHSGAFSQGAATRAVLVPSQNLGVIALSNGFGSGVPEAIAEAVIDFARHGKLAQDWLAHWKGIFYDAFFRPPQEQEAKYAHPPYPAAQPLPVSSYTGTFRNDYLGDVEVTEQSGRLTVFLGPGRMPFPLRHWNGNIFLSFPEPETPGYPAPVTFGIDSTGKAAQVILEDLNGGGMGTVTRVKA